VHSARRDCSRLRRSSLRDRRRFATASNLAAGQVVELNLFICREFEWDAYRELGPRGALGTLYNLARPERFELPTTWFEAKYSIQLSYGRMKFNATAREGAPSRWRQWGKRDKNRM
jgi:hypothetical protein